MKPSTKMLLASSRGDMTYGDDMAYGGRKGMQYGIGRVGNTSYGGRSEAQNYGESRFRDRKGREHYDNGRYAPRSEYDMGMSFGGREDGHYVEPDVYRREYKMGFAASDDDDEKLINIRRMDDGMSSTFTKETADKWMKGLKNSDGTTGPHWTLEQIKQVMAQKNIQCDPVELWAAMNAEYSDRSKVNKKYNVNTVDFYLDSAKAFWLEDEDAKEDKLLQYYKSVVRHK